MGGKYTPGTGGSLGEEAAEVLDRSAHEVGLEVRAVIRAEPLSTEVQARLDPWFEEGRAGEMGYLERSREQFPDLRNWKPWAKSAALFSAPYFREAGGFRGGGRVARYALGRDYHHVLGRRLERLGKRLREAGLIDRFRGVTDAAPVLEREWALRGALGFRGKNTLLLHPAEGPWHLLGELLVDAEWPERIPDAPKASCAGCTRCLDACPTSAFPDPYSLDPRRCISYLTIEHRGSIPAELRPLIGEWVFGCDVCMEVCPFGAVQPSREAEWGRLEALDRFTLEDLLRLTEHEFHEAFTGSPIRRTGWEGLLRNACIALGNLGHGESAVAETLETHSSPLVRAHAAWALGRLKSTTTLKRSAANEAHEAVLAEVRDALAAAGV